MYSEFAGVYIMGNKRPTMYTGVSNNLFRRIKEHKMLKHGFTKKYNLTACLYYEFIPNMLQAIIREKQIKNLSRPEKINLIKQKNPFLSGISSQLFSLIDDVNTVTVSQPYQTPDKPE